MANRKRKRKKKLIKRLRKWLKRWLPVLAGLISFATAVLVLLAELT